MVKSRNIDNDLRIMLMFSLFVIVTPNVRGMKLNSSPDGQLQHQQDEHHIDDSQHITEMVS